MSDAWNGRLAAVVVISLCMPAASAEDLNAAWSQAIGINAGVQASQFDSLSAGMSLGAARSAIFPSMSVTALNAFLSQSPVVRVPASLAGAGAGASAFKGGFPALGPNQSDVPFVFANISQRRGGRIHSNIEAARAGANFEKTEVFRTVLDLKLTVAEAYVGVLRAKRNLDVQRSNVAQLAAFLRDVTNRKAEGQATRNEQLAAEVKPTTLLQEISACKNLDVAWATYNRYLYRPPGLVVDLEEITEPSPSDSLDALTADALKQQDSTFALSEPIAADLAGRALQERPELEGLAERARQSDALASATMATIKPQFSFNASYIDIGAQNFTNPNLFAGTFQLSWTVFDGGQTRRRAEAQRLQARSYMRKRADTSADIVLEVRTRMLDVDESRQRVIVSGAAVASAEENIKVVTDRYRQGLSLYTEVLDAENRRLQSQNGYYAAVYDNAIARFRLHRATGDL